MKPINLPSLCFGVLLFAYLGFIGAASFYLTTKIPTTADAISTLLQRGSSFSFSFHNLRDISTNILLYIPFGFFFAMFLATYRTINIVSPHLLWGFICSLSVEVIQAFVGRFSDLSDIISNSTGYILGYTTAYVAVRFFYLRPSALLGLSINSTEDAIQNISGIRFAYITIAYATCLLPLNLTVSLSDIFSKLTSVDGSDPRIIIDPLYHFAASSFDFTYLSVTTLLFLPLAFLSAHIQIRKNQPNLLIPATHCLIFGLVIELSNIFVKSGRTDITVPMIGFIVGVAMTYLLSWHHSRSTTSTSTSPNAASQQNYTYVSAILLYALFLLTISLSPFEFEFSLREIKNKALSESNFIPFYAHFSARSIGSAIDIVRQVALFIPMGTLLGLYCKSLMSNTLAGLVTLTLGISYALIIESLQLVVVQRYVDTTDILLSGLGVFSGLILTPLFSSKKSSNRS